jgi:hypothetical protein
VSALRVEGDDAEEVVRGFGDWGKGEDVGLREEAEREGLKVHAATCAHTYTTHKTPNFFQRGISPSSFFYDVQCFTS